MNHQWALGHVNKFLGASEMTWDPEADCYTYVAGDDEVQKQCYVVQQILNVVIEDWDAEYGPNVFHEYQTTPDVNYTRTWALRAQGRLELGAELDENLAEDAPTMSARALHPWVWEPAARLWLDGHYRSALHLAATALVSITQAKTNRHEISDRNLYQEVFNLSEPTPGKPRLRVRDDDGSETYKSAQQGALYVGMGLSLGVRNLAAHGIKEIDEQEALEQLAALSLLARWIDGAKLVTESDDSD